MMFDEMVGTLREMRRLLDVQQKAAPLLHAAVLPTATGPASSPLLPAAAGREPGLAQQLAAGFPLLGQLPPGLVSSLAFLQATQSNTSPQML